MFNVVFEDLLFFVCSMLFEGVIGKCVDVLYCVGCSLVWIKFKCGQWQEFVIGGYSVFKGSCSGFGVFLFGVYDDVGKLCYVGCVGIGFNEMSLYVLYYELMGLIIDMLFFVNLFSGSDVCDV